MFHSHKATEDREMVLGKSRLIAKSRSRGKGVDYSVTFLHPSAMFYTRFVVAPVPQFDSGFPHFDVEQAFLQSELGHYVHTRKLEGCGDSFVEIALPKRNHHGLRQATRSPFDVQVSALKLMASEQRPHDAYEPRLQDSIFKFQVQGSSRLPSDMASQEHHE